MDTRALEAISRAIKPMLHSRLGNYIVPGVTSHLVGGSQFGKVRLFSAERNARDFVTPHSHRFDFTCLVLAGTVHNTLFMETGSRHGAESWCKSTIDQVCGADGLLEYTHTRNDKASWYSQETYEYGFGDTYYMPADAIHSIVFGAGTSVLFFEGPQVIAQSLMLEPWVDGKCIPTFKTESWMFERD